MRPQAPSAFLAYRVEEDRCGEWRELADPDVAWGQVRPTPAFSPGRPLPEEARDAETTEAEAGDDRLLFLGSSWPDGYEDARLDARAWLWSQGH